MEIEDRYLVKAPDKPKSEIICERCKCTSHCDEICPCCPNDVCGFCSCILCNNN